MALPNRKKQATKPNTLPADFLKSVRELFTEQFADTLGGASFMVYSDLYPNELILCVSLFHEKALRAATLYLSTDLAKNVSEKPEKVTEQLKILVDVAASWFAQCFEKGNGLEAALEMMEDSSNTWEKFEWEGEELYAKLTADNRSLEAAANKFLESAGLDPEDEISDEELEELMAELEDEMSPTDKKKMH